MCNYDPNFYNFSFLAESKADFKLRARHNYIKLSINCKENLFNIDYKRTRYDDRWARGINEHRLKTCREAAFAGLQKKLGHTRSTVTQIMNTLEQKPDCKLPQRKFSRVQYTEVRQQQTPKISGSVQRWRNLRKKLLKRHRNHANKCSALEFCRVL